MEKEFNSKTGYSYSKVSKIGIFATSILGLFMGGLMISESVLSVVANQSFIFPEGVNRGFEFLVGIVAIVLAAVLIDSKVYSLSIPRGGQDEND